MGSGCCAGKASACTASKDSTQSEQSNGAVDISTAVSASHNGLLLESAVANRHDVSGSCSSQNKAAIAATTFSAGFPKADPYADDTLQTSRIEATERERKTPGPAHGCSAPGQTQLAADSSSLPVSTPDPSGGDDTPRVGDGSPTSVGVCTLLAESSPSEEVSRCGGKKNCCTPRAVDGPIHDSKEADSGMKECCTKSVGADMRTETESCCAGQESAGNGGPVDANFDEVDNGEACNSGNGLWLCSSSTGKDCCNGMSISGVSIRSLGADNIRLQKSVSRPWRRPSVMKLAMQKIGVSIFMAPENHH